MHKMVLVILMLYVFTHASSCGGRIVLNKAVANGAVNIYSYGEIPILNKDFWSGSEFCVQFEQANDTIILFDVDATDTGSVKISQKDFTGVFYFNDIFGGKAFPYLEGVFSFTKKKWRYKQINNGPKFSEIKFREFVSYLNSSPNTTNVNVGPYGEYSIEKALDSLRSLGLRNPKKVCLELTK